MPGHSVRQMLRVLLEGTDLVELANAIRLLTERLFRPLAELIEISLASFLCLWPDHAAARSRLDFESPSCQRLSRLRIA